MRNAEYSTGVRTYSRYADGVWYVEMVLPRKQNNLDTDEFQFSAGIRLQNESLHLKHHTLWYDNVDAFLIGRCVTSPVQCEVEQTHQGWHIKSSPNADLTVSLDKVRQVTHIKEVVMDQTMGMTTSFQPLKNIAKVSGCNIERTIPAPSLGLYAITYHVKDKKGQFLLARQLPFIQRKDVEIHLAGNVIAKTLKAVVAFPGIAVKQNEPFTIVIRDHRGKTIAQDTQKPAEDAVSELQFAFNTDGWDTGKYSVELSRGTTVLGQKEYELTPLPEWYTKPVATAALSPDYAPAPWKDGVKVDRHTIRVWGREFVFGPEGLERIISQGGQVLAAPIKVVYRQNGVTHTIALALEDINVLGKGRTAVRTGGQDGLFSVQVRHTIEFDGLDTVELTLSPKSKSVHVEEMSLVLPVANAPYFQTLYDYTSQEMGYTIARDFKRLTALWLGNDDFGLNTFFENHKGLLIDSRRPRIRLTKGVARDAFDYALHLANTPVAVERPITWRLGIHPTPIKPLYPNWEDERIFMMEYFMHPFNFICLHTHGHAANSTDFQARNQKLGQMWGEMGRLHNQKIYPYTIATFISKENMIKPHAPNLRYRLPDSYFYEPDERPQSQEWAKYGADWSFQPVSTYPGDGSRHNEMIACSPASSWSDYAVWKMQKYLQDGGFAGFYFDLTTSRENCDEARGYRYNTLDGKSEGTRELFATRNLLKRLYFAFAELKGEGTPTIFAHGYPILSGASSFWGLCIHGEEFKAKRLLGLTDMMMCDRQIATPVMNTPPKGFKRDYSGAIWRIVYSPYIWGIPMSHLSQYAFHPEMSRNPKSGREMLALCMVNNTLFDPSYAHWQTGEEFHLRVTMPFGMGGTKFHGYWNNDVKSTPECVKVSYWQKTGCNDYLVAIANWSEQDVTAEITLPDHLKNAYYVYNMETANRVGRWEDITPPWRVRIPAADLRVFRFCGTNDTTTLTK